MTPRDPFVDLQSALSVTPSREFSLRVRARLATEAPASRAQSPAWWLGAMAAAAAVVLAVTVWTVERDHSVGIVLPSTAIANAPSARDVLAPPATSPQLVPAVRASRGVPRLGSHREASREIVARTASDAFGEVLVPSDQRLAIERLLAAIKAGRASVPPAAIAAVDEDGHSVITPLPEISPIRIEPLAGTPADPNKLEQIKKEQ
jgi:hypothetical protein